MRFFPIILLALLAFVVVTDGFRCGPMGRFCDEKPYLEFAGSAGATVDKEGMKREFAGTLGQKCKVDNDCIYSHMETIVPRCTNGICDNYHPERGDVHHIP
ncbi:hypothetical protein GCK72_025468 [Caenorhabditis remanei]|uniref:Uncharacterized protein n=1 Tax=Caenorhabditis remanei TaxID=31234 RepID=A0A6A5G2P0_CAERE|nr:hypothetical protein GCK72_025468 [Caenorhabditis remanei]KAF1749001.1 hypothetical protein GCK72_025468 [Caenorhabditis remanei]